MSRLIDPHEQHARRLGLLPPREESPRQPREDGERAIADRADWQRRRHRAREMRLIGRTYDEIGHELDISRQRAFQLVHYRPPGK